jgi:hypothetical protein
MLVFLILSFLMILPPKPCMLHVPPTQSKHPTICLNIKPHATLLHNFLDPTLLATSLAQVTSSAYILPTQSLTKIQANTK